MEKITDKIAALPADGTYFSLEFFPPKTQTVSSAPIALMPQLMAPLGFCKSASATGTHVPSLEASIRKRYLGSWWKHRVQIS